jgi:uncharacterized repeat protein (TIGR01451 family)
MIRVLCGAILLLAAGCLLLGSASRSRTFISSPPAESLRSPLQDATLFGAAPAAFTPRNSGKGNSGQALTVLGQLPLMFEPNVGQVSLGQANLGQASLGQASLGQVDPGQLNSSRSNSAVKFLARGHGYSLFLDSQGATLALRSHDQAGTRTESLRMKLAGASRGARVAGTDLLPGKTNYFLGNDPSKWRAGVPQFARVSYENIYPGINLVFYGNQGQLEYDFRVAPGADPSQAQLEFEGSQKVELSSGSLILKCQGGNLRFEAPRVYQELDGRRQAVEGRFALLASNRVGFEVGAYDHSRELIIDPVLLYATFFGGTGDDKFPSIAVDILGNIYMAGSTTSPNLPVMALPSTSGVFQSTLNAAANAQNVFVLKLNPQAGTGGVEYLTYLGGSGIDTSVGLGVDGAGNAYVAGTTTSPDFPTTPTAYQLVPKAGSAGPHHVFVSVLDPNLSGLAQLTYSSYLSGSGDDIASGMTIDAATNVYITGTTTSTAPSDQGTNQNDFPASAPPQFQAFQPITRGAPIQFFVTKVDTSAAGIGSIPYSTYFGGGTPSNGTAVGGSIAVDTTGNIYFTGTTNFFYTGQSPLTDFPILNAYQPCLDQPPPLVIVQPPTCSNTASAVDTDAFLAKLNNPTNLSQQSALAWSTYFGGSDVDTGTGIAVDVGALNVYITGSTNSPDFIFPTTISAFQLCLDAPHPVPPTPCPTITQPAATDAYVARFNNPSGAVMALTYFSYLGGSGNEVGNAITVDPASDALITGYTQSTDLPIFPASVIQGTLLSTVAPPLTPQNAFFGRLNTTTLSGQSPVGAYVTYYGGTGVDQGSSVVLDSNLNTYFAGDTTSPTLQTLNPLQATNAGGIDTFVVKLGTAADLAITNAQITNPVNSQHQVGVGTQVSTAYTITNNGPDLATNVVVLGTVPTGTTFNSGSATSGSCSSTVTAGSVACTISSLQAGSTATVTIALTPNQPGGYTSSASVSSAINIDPLPGNNSGSVSFTATGFVLSASPNAFAVQAAGDSAFYTVTVTPQPVYGSGVSLSVSGLPGGSKSTFSEPTLTLTGESPASSTLTISTTVRPVNIGSFRPGRGRPGRGALYAASLIFPAMAFLGFGVRDKRRRRRVGGLLMMCVLFGLVWLQPACSGGTTPPITGGTPPGTYNLVVSATGGTFSKNQTIQLVVP